MQKYHTIGGWLYLPGLHLILILVMNVMYIFRSFIPMFTSGTWGVITSPEYANYHPVQAPLILYEFAGNCALIIFSGYLLYHYLKRHTCFPKLAMVFYLVFPLFKLSVAIPVEILFPPQGDAIPLGGAGQQIIPSIIWILYFMKSERVKGTFVN